MTLDYDIETCRRCGDNFQTEIKSLGSFGSGTLVLGIFRSDPNAQPGYGTLQYCPPCGRYRERAVERAKEIARKKFSRKSYEERSSECSKCGGSGHIGQFTCPKCEGEGRLEDSLFSSGYGENAHINFEVYKEFLPDDFDKA